MLCLVLLGRMDHRLLVQKIRNQIAWQPDSQPSEKVSQTGRPASQQGRSIRLMHIPFDSIRFNEILPASVIFH